MRNSPISLKALDCGFGAGTQRSIEQIGPCPQSGAPSPQPSPVVPPPAQPVAAIRWVGRRLGAIGKRIGEVQTWLLLTLFYVLLLGPVALLFRLFRDPLGLRKGFRSGWHVRAPKPDDGLAWGKAQF